MLAMPNMTRNFLIAVVFTAPLLAQAPADAPSAAKPTIMARPAAPTVSLSPAVVQARGKYGQTLTESLTLTNQTGGDFAFEMTAQDVIVRNGKRQFVPAGELPNSIAQTAVFSTARGVASSYTTASVTVRLTIPADTKIRAVVVIFRGTAPAPSQNGSVGMVASLGALITFNLSDDVRVEGLPVKVAPPDAASNWTIAERLRNTGSEPAVVSGIAAVLNADGRLAGKMPFDAQRLLPGEELDFKAEYPADLPKGAYRVLCTFDYEGKQFTSTGAFHVE
jgi:hypothetical protein